MADFWQQGAITVLQRLKNRPIEELEKEIEAIARRRRVVLLLPRRPTRSRLRSAAFFPESGGG